MGALGVYCEVILVATGWLRVSVGGCGSVGSMRNLLTPMDEVP